jgi:hypothetical protein
MSLTKRSLGPAQLKLVEAIEELGFGRIDQIPVCDGSPCLERATQTVREIKLGLDTESFDRSSGGPNTED